MTKPGLTVHRLELFLAKVRFEPTQVLGNGGLADVAGRLRRRAW